jgi:epidermal growth factor receptor kinase substrate 8
MLLNRCFDDIEKYVARLQMAADAFRELEQRRNTRAKGGRNALGGMAVTLGFYQLILFIRRI